MFERVGGFVKLVNISFEEVQKYLEEGRLISVKRSKFLKVPKEVLFSVMDKRFYELWDIVQGTGELFNCKDIEECLNGFDVEIRD